MLVRKSVRGAVIRGGHGSHVPPQTSRAAFLPHLLLCTRLETNIVAIDGTGSSQYWLVSTGAYWSQRRQQDQVMCVVLRG